MKNRFGAVSELGVFEMTGAGLVAVPNPSRLFLSDRAAGVPGSVVLCSLEGTRPILVEVQALVSTGAYGTARRMASGIDHNRLSLLLAVLEKRAGLGLAGEDVFVNVAGGAGDRRAGGRPGRGGGGGVEPAGGAAFAPARRCSARWGWAARCAGRRRAALRASARRRSSDSRAASCPP